MNRFKLIDKYLLKKFMVTFCAAMGIMIVLIIVFDVSEKLDDFLERKAPLQLIIFQYYINFIPSFINDYSALFTFISIIFFTSKLAGNTEIIAILSSGISFKRMLRPYVYGALIIAVLTFFLGNFVIPYLNQERLIFERQYIKNPYRNTFQNIHLQMDKDLQLYVESFDNVNNTAYRFSYEKFGENEIKEKFTSETIVFDTVTRKWFAYNYVLRTVNGLNETFKRGDTMTLHIKFYPEDLNINRKNVITMNLVQLTTFIEQEKVRGSHLVKDYEILNYQRIVNPFAVVVMTFIAVSVSFRKARGGVGLHLALGLLIAFAFVVFMKFSTVFSIKGNLPPLISVLIPIVVFGVAAYILIRKAPK